MGPRERLSQCTRLAGCFADLLALVGAGAFAADVDKKFRLALLVGGGIPTDEIRSNGANVLTVLDGAGMIVDRYNDPRDDAAITGKLKARTGGMATLSLQYAVTPLFLIEGRVGYETGDVGKIEVQEVVNFRRIVRVPAGELTRIPVQLQGVVRFRPEATFNPYAGGAIGYTANDFDMSPELKGLSTNLELSRGKRTVLASENLFDAILNTQEPLRPLQGARVDAGDAFEWRIVGGAELGFGEHWATFLDMGYVFSDATIRIGFDGAEDLGVGVPQGATRAGSELTTTDYGPFQILQGGALDLTGDGVPDPGYYYIEGGRLRLDGLTFQFGVRYTF